MSGTSRISREAYVRFCEVLEVKFLGPTQRKRGVGQLAPSYRAHLRLYQTAIRQGTTDLVRC
jgi:hypothetical protein